MPSSQFVAAHTKASEDNIPLFGWQDDGWLTMTNTTGNQPPDESQVVQRDAPKKGFKIKQVGL